MALKSLIAETEHVIAIRQDLGGESVVVTFNEMGFVRDGLRFWGDEFLLKHGISAIGIVTPRPNWYPRHAMDEVLAAVREAIAGRRVLTYGHGQGGYGAMKFAARLGASATLAFCPQWSIDPADVASFDTRFTNYFDESLVNGLRIEQEDLCASSFIFHDKMASVNAGHVAKLAALQGVRTVVSPFSTSGAIRNRPEGGCTTRLISVCARDTPPTVTELRQIIRASRPDARIYFDQMLRELILRIRVSRSHSSLFASRLLARCNDDKPFYRALIAHAQGNASLALSELRNVIEESFDKADLLSWLQFLNKLRFAAAQQMVSGLICKQHSKDTVACLHAVESLIGAGNRDRAQGELARLVKHGDALNHIGRFIELALKLRKPDMIETILAEIKPGSARVHVLFRVVEFYRRLGDRRQAFHKLLELAKTCADSPTDLRKVADRGMALGERTFAREIRERLLLDAPRDYLLALEALQARIPSNALRIRSDKARYLADLNAIMRVADLPAACWEQASRLYEVLEADDEALQAITKAVSLPDSGRAARQRLAILLMRRGLHGRARGELENLLRECAQDPKRLRVLGEIAFKLPDRQLALKFAEAQWQCGPSDPECILHLAHHLKIVGDLTRARRLLAELVRRERRAPSISDEQWITLAQGLHDVGDSALTKEAVAEVISREPGNPVAAKLTAATAFMERFGTTGLSYAAREPAPKQPRLGLASRLAKILRR